MAATHCYSKLRRSCPRSHRSRHRNDCWPHTVGCSRAWNPSDSSCWLNTEGCRGVLGSVKYLLLFQLQQCRENKMSKDAFNQGRNYTVAHGGALFFRRAPQLSESHERTFIQVCTSVENNRVTTKSTLLLLMQAVNTVSKISHRDNNSNIRTVQNDWWSGQTKTKGGGTYVSKAQLLWQF